MNSSGDAEIGKRLVIGGGTSNADADSRPAGSRTAAHATEDGQNSNELVAPQPSAGIVEDNFCSPSNRSFYESGQYRKLYEAVKEKRVLLLNFDDKFQDRIALTVQDRFTLETARDLYTAISYMAGDHKKTVEVPLNQHKFNVFASVAKILRQLHDAMRKDADRGEKEPRAG